ncbi:hypothetical protein CJ030_MR7G023845 [Morella rubra]|uniref:Uncharacterized protein n=1 Tax=Morella rubra TaxID=262757 RepID=A0A6A1V821_9ROSI|nr:hypothetical protein CJ030_MR7G023845 [Morella rubra]
MDEEPSTSQGIRCFLIGIHQQQFKWDFCNHKVISRCWVLLHWFTENGFDFQNIFDYQGWSYFGGLKCDSFPYLVKQSFANFVFTFSKDASSHVKGKDLDLYVTAINAMALSPNSGVKFFEVSDVEPVEILRVFLDDPSLDEIVKPEASDLKIHRQLLHYMEVEEELEEEEGMAKANLDGGIPIAKTPHSLHTPAARCASI